MNLAEMFTFGLGMLCFHGKPLGFREREMYTYGCSNVATTRFRRQALRCLKTEETLYNQMIVNYTTHDHALL